LLLGSKNAEGKLAAEPLEPARAGKMLGCFAEHAVGSSQTGSKDSSSSSSTQQCLGQQPHTWQALQRGLLPPPVAGGHSTLVTCSSLLAVLE